MYTVLRWSGSFALAATPSNRIVTRGNSVFDPGFTSGSSQPVGFDNWAGLYLYYRVLWSSIKVMYVGRTSATDNQIITLYPSLNSNPYSTAVDANPSQAYAKSRVYQAGNTQPAIMTSYMTSKKLFGDRDDTDDGYGALATANPASVWYWLVDIIQFSGGNADTGSYVTIEVNYGTRFEGRQNMAMS